MTILDHLRTFKASASRQLQPWNPLARLRFMSLQGFPFYSREIYNIDHFLERFRSDNRNLSGASALDLGCGLTPRNPFRAQRLIGLDIISDESRNIFHADLSSDKIPFEDSTFDFVTAFDFIEHVPRISVATNSRTRYPFVQLMNEISRVLKPGGIFFSHTPAFPSKEVFKDPTHVNIITEDTFGEYFSGRPPSAKASIYGYDGNLEILDQAWYKCWLLSVLAKQ